MLAWNLTFFGFKRRHNCIKKLTNMGVDNKLEIFFYSVLSLSLSLDFFFHYIYLFPLFIFLGNVLYF